ncbi:MAG: D-alanyl-D-alanine carboxypeptidase/D-alanyl-D-alanine-endopeptidase [Rhodobacteraceae bacterium]|nr:D-alanyl-D-alanine carboxypeptidase/D-alanyl-D-alanine-endopeptidase [Paracoccaceae bacterium]
MKRRDFLGGVIAGLPLAAYGEVRPPARAGRPVRVASASDIVQQFGIGDKTGFVVMDLATGQVLEAHNPTLDRPPASVTKAITSLYADAHLGADFRFETRIATTGPINNGRLEGDLFLVGGGDPHLDTDALAELAQQVASAGLRSISGRFYYVDTALPKIDFIDADQPDQVGYNPSISGLNLNFNRVYFEWKKTGGAYNITMEARASRYRPAVTTSEMTIVNRNGPVYAYGRSNGIDHWTVARSALGNSGSRWLPVRDPGAYTASVFRNLAAAFGVALPAPQQRASARGSVIARQFSRDLRGLQRSMLYFSTNLTAEVLGMQASIAAGNQVAGLRASARHMSRWASQQVAQSSPVFYNHSGLTDQSKISAQEMVMLLAQRNSQQGLAGLMKKVQLLTPRGDAATVPNVEVLAKTGTLNFTRGLAGYIEGQGQQKLAFAIFSADLGARRAAGISEERPRGARSWSRNARAQEKALLYRWATQFV